MPWSASRGQGWVSLDPGEHRGSVGGGGVINAGPKAAELLREPRKPHDTRVEVWLAPSLHYLPVRAKHTTENSSWDLRLQSSQPPT